MSCNSLEVMNKGYYKTQAFLNETQRVKFGIESYTAFKIKPYCVQLYNKYMNGIDVVDQLISSYDRHQRAKSWKSIYISTSLKMAEASAYKLYSLYCEANYLVGMNHAEFKQEIALELLKQGRATTTTVAPPRDLTIEDIHFQRVHKKKFKCRHFKCDNNSRYSCGACLQKKQPLYLCLKHLESHQKAEKDRLETT